MNIRDLILEKTDGGYDIFEFYLKDIDISKKQFKLREEESTPSASLTSINGIWRIKDFGDPEYDMFSKNAIDFVMFHERVDGFINTMKKIINDMKLDIDINDFSMKKQTFGYEIDAEFCELNDKQREYLHSRKLSDETIEYLGIKGARQFFPQSNSELDAIAFPYYNENGFLVNAKYRGAYKDENGKVQRAFTMHKGGQLDMYGINKIDKNVTEAFFVEGETDAATMVEFFISQGIPPMLVLSVPNGVNSLARIPRLSERLSHIKTFYLFVDEGKAGRGLQSRLVEVFGKQRCKIVPKIGGDDINEIFTKHGVKGIASCVNDAEYLKVEGDISVTECTSSLYDMFLHSVPRGETLGYPSFDKIFTWSRPQLTLVTGTPASGKSSVVKQILVRLARLSNWKAGIFSPEDATSAKFYRKLMMQSAGKAFPLEGRHIPVEFQMSDDEFWLAQSFVEEYFRFANPESYDLDSLLELASVMIRQHDLKCFVIDPFNYISIPSRDTGVINDILTRLNRFKIEENIHIILVAHPRKMNKKVKYEEGKKVETMEFEIPTPYDVAHSSDFYNQVDNSVTIARSKDDTVEWIVQKFRDDDLGSLGKAVFSFNYWSKTYNEIF